MATHIEKESISEPQISSVPSAPPLWARVAPFFFSALLFLSAVFSIVSPLPVLVARLKSGRKIAALAVITNGALVLLLGSGPSLFFYLTLLIVPAFVLGEFLAKTRRLIRSLPDGSVSVGRGLSIEKSVLVSLLSGVLFGALAWVVYCQVHHFQPWTHLKQQVSAFVDLIFKAVPAPSSEWVGSPEAEALRESMGVEFPSGVLIFMLLSLWANLLLVLRLNPKNLRLRLGWKMGEWRDWKAPEHLVWPTIACGAGLLGDFGLLTDVCLNGFRVLMAIYALQGLSILSFLFDVWRVSGIFRSLAYLLALMLMLPLVLALGFFDLWFDFRGKFRQSL